MTLLNICKQMCDANNNFGLYRFIWVKKKKYSWNERMRQSYSWFAWEMASILFIYIIQCMLILSFDKTGHKGYMHIRTSTCTCTDTGNHTHTHSYSHTIWNL